MSTLNNLLTSTEPLDAIDRKRLEDWRDALRADCDLFGVTAEDAQRLRAIRRRLEADKEHTPRSIGRTE